MRREIPGQPDEVEGYAYNALGALSTHQGESVDHQRPRLDNLGTAPAGIPASHDGDTVTLDAGGHITALLGATLTHTKQTRLRDIVEGATTHKFGFDALQRRIGYQKTGQTTEVYLHEGDDIVAVINGSGLAGIQRRILYDAIDHPLWMYDAAEDITLYFELDTIGNVRRLRGGRTLDPDGTPPPADLGGYRYTAFGRLQPPDAGTPYPALDGAPFEQPIRWQGRWYVDAAGGVYDFRARTWSPEIGAFLQLDEYSYLTRTGTLWSWPGQNPFRWRDPTGREGCENGGDPNATLEAMAEQFILRHGERIQRGLLIGSATLFTMAGGGYALAAAGVLVRVGWHTAHHFFNAFGRKLPHVQLNIWREGVRNSGRVRRLPLPRGLGPNRNRNINFN